MNTWLRKAVREAKPGVHGSLDVAELRRWGIAPESVIDFSANLNPYGASPKVAQALAGVAVSRYPDRHCTDLHRAIAKANRVGVDHVLAGNGSSELIHLLAFASLEKGTPVVVVGPTYCEYARAAQLCGARVLEVAAAPPDFAPPVDLLCQTILRERPRLVFLCHPNNPTGVYLDREAVRRIHESTQQASGVLVLDEAYVDCVADAWDSIATLGLEGMVVLRSLTKLHGLAGVRLGYALAEPSLIQGMKAVQPPWSVNAFAQAAGVAALADTAHLERSRQAWLQERQVLQSALAAIGYRVLPSRTPFFLMEVDCAAAFRQHCLRQGVLVRDGTSFGLPDYVRISARTPKERPRLIEAAFSFRSCQNREVAVGE